MSGAARIAALALAGALGAGLAACGDAELKAAGQPCVASSECAAGLVCDLLATPAVCTDHVTTDATVIDAAIDAFQPIDASAADAAVDAAIDAPVDAAVDAPPAATAGAPGL